MIEVLEFIFQSFWHWLGSVIILAIIAACIGECLSNFRRSQ